MMSPLVFFFFLIQLANQTRVSSVSWGHGRIDLFVKGTNSDVWHTYYDNSHWYPWEDLLVPLGTNGNDPAVCSWSQYRIDIFIYGYDPNNPNTLYHNAYHNTKQHGQQWAYQPNSWGTWDTDVFGVSCFSMGYGQIQVATVHSDYNFYTMSWSPIPNMVNNINLGNSNIGQSPPGIMIIYPTIFFFARDRSNPPNVIYKIVNKTSDGSYTTVTDWTRTGDSTQKGVAVAAWDNTRMDIFFLGPDNTMYQKTIVQLPNLSWNFTASNTSMGDITFGGTPSVTSWGYGRFDVFGMASNGNFIWTKTYDLCKGEWSEWKQLGDFVAHG